MATWLKKAVFYEIYPNSFLDTNGDGYGDFKGITSKLDYIKSLGCNAIWINPIYDSPFRDGGYDVRDFFKVSKRFGILDDFKELLKVAAKLEIRICLDLVPGHASEENPLFIKSASPIRNEYSDMFIWNKSPWELPDGYRFISGRYERNGNYLVNFFSTQPAINYGFYEITDPNWQLSYQDPRCLKQRNYLKQIIRYWFDLGVAGFRVDMADSLVKNDPDKVATIALWQEVLQEIKKDYSEHIFISEWSSPRAIKAGFDVDFILDHYHNFLNRLVRYEETGNHSVFDALGRGDAKKCFEVFIKWFQEIKDLGDIGIITCNHDTPRLGGFYSVPQLKIIYTTLFMLPGIPFLYYGDEIGMKYQKDLPSKECGFQRTGSRTPMQWNQNKHRGFSVADDIFLPVDTTSEIDVATQEDDPNSLLNVVRESLRFRASHEDILGKDFQFVKADRGLFSFKRHKLLVIVNPLQDPKTYRIKSAQKIIYQVNEATNENGLITLKPFSLVIISEE
ncbi:MAG: glycosylase [Erysipelotrichaceae bacterium]|jgi:maltose alpha-D-glucosyltransferase/alpha-amylase|nr:glycosylase [Erysipelotrichaceae bacterium]